jgi:nitric oxide reductase NorD protein
MPDTRAGIMLHRFEGFLGWTEFVPVNRGGEEEDDDDAARRAADDLDVMSVARDATAGSSRVRFDLDLPSSASDDLALGPGIALPEWDFSSARLQAGYCRLQPMIAADAPPVDLPPPLRITARRLRRQFEALRPARQWVRNAPDGSDVDLDAYIQYAAERQQGERAGDMRWYRDFRNGERSLACLLLADLSLSTDTWIGNHARVIDVIRDSLFLFAEALSAVGDELGIFGFSSRRRDHVRFNVLKDFSETYNREVRGRIAAIKPGYYTRMGAAIRYASRLLAQRSAQQRLLLIVTDGKPNDLDRYEGRYGIEDTRHAVQDARKQGLEPFCVTVDAEAGDYLPHLFGNDGYVLVRTPSELPARLPAVYARLTR